MNTAEIVSAILRREGGDKFTDSPHDRGGPTKWGITQKAWSEYVGHPATVDEIKAISETQARNFYYILYIDRPDFDRIKDEFLAEFVIDCGVNHGVRRASQWLQSAAGVDVDGVIGGDTLAAVNSQSAAKLFLQVFAIRTKFYAKIASDQLPTDPDLPNLQGWINRALEFITRYANSLP